VLYSVLAKFIHAILTGRFMMLRLLMNTFGGFQINHSRG